VPHSPNSFFFSPTLIQHSPGIPSQSNKARRKIKGMQIGKEAVKLSLFAADMIIYLQDQKNSIQKLLDTVNSFSNVARYIINLKNQ
jgi:alpha-D-ribose 1-methylphosphonate 5-triphosphate synthase subunit PhnH